MEKYGMGTRKGKLTIFTSYTPGAGKSHYMIERALEFQKQGKNVVFGFLNTEHRDTFCNEIVWARKHSRGTTYSLKKILMKVPDLVVMDEMGMFGHNEDQPTYVYQDIRILLHYGIDVYTSVNLKRFHSLNPKFYDITGIKIKKTIPDIWLDIAEKIYFIDRDPTLIKDDYQKGKIFPEKQTGSRILKKNFDIHTLWAYRNLSLDILSERYGDKLTIRYRN